MQKPLSGLYKSVYRWAEEISKRPEDNGCVIIDLWANSDREVDVVPTSTVCNHQNVSNNICLQCGSFVGYIGEEQDWNVYWRNVFLLSRVLEYTTFVIISRKEIPLYVTSINVSGVSMRFAHSRKTYYFPRDGVYAMTFHRDSTSPTNYSLVCDRGSVYSFIMQRYNVTHVINPPKKVLRSPGKVRMHECNKGVSI